jgi:hypothetical protein
MNRTFTLEATAILVTEECCNCHMVFAMPNELVQQRQRDHQTFYCPNGHAQHYTGKSDVEQLREQLAATERDMNYYAERSRGEQRRAEAAERKAAAHKGVATKLKKRAAAGVCPCCNRHFEALARHMKSKHPDFAESKS